MPDLLDQIYNECYQAVYAGVNSSVEHSNVRMEDSINNLLGGNGSGLAGTKENNGIKYRINYSYPPSQPETKPNQIQIDHFRCSVEIVFDQWPNEYKSVHIYQFCNLIHKIIYGTCNDQCKSKGKQFCESCQILIKYLFHKSIIGSHSPEQYVLDSCSHDTLSYAGITKNDFDSGTRSLIFNDLPCGLWNVEHENFPLHKIDKKQSFLLYVAGVKDNDEMDVLQSWEWGYDMTYCNGNLDHKCRKLVEINKELPKHLIYLPNANDCLFKFQFSNKSLGKPGGVLEYPKMLPKGLTEETFNRKVIIELNCAFKQYSMLILSVIIQYLSKLILSTFA